MDTLGWFVFLGSVLLGSYVQAVTGFAMGMIVIAVVGASELIGLPVLTAAASLITMVNVALALKGQLQHLHRGLFKWLAAGQLPAIWVGVWLLTVLDRDAQTVLQLLLGAFITLGSLSMMLRPLPLARVSSPWATWVAGIVGGLIGGMFSASGPIMGWFNYRQPLQLAQIRTTLLCVFALSTSTRTVVVGYQGGLTQDVWLLADHHGAFITLGSLSMMLRPLPLARVSSPWATWVAGIVGGLIGGMFSASGPIMGWFNYRQPLQLAQIRTTLLCVFALSTSTRTVVVGYQGGLTQDVWLLAGFALPLVILGTWAGRGLPPAVTDATFKRIAFGLLLVMGIWILATAF